MADAPMSRSAEWRAHWTLVLAATIGLSFSSVVTYSTGLFMEPLQHEFGWSRTQVSSGLTVAAVFAVFFSGPAGTLIDKWGTRRFAIPGLALAAGCLALFGLVNGSIVQWLALWGIYSVVALAVKSTIWTAAVSGTFTAARGLALAVTLSGAAIAQIVAPPLTNWLIDAVGWRMAYVALGTGWGGVALILVCLFQFDSHDRARSRKAGSQHAKPPSLNGLTIREALRNPALLRIGLATLITMMLGLAVLVHQVPIYTEAGVTRQNAAYLAGLAGVAAIVGKLASGWMLDRWDAGWVGSLTLAFSTIAFPLLMEPFRTSTLVLVATLIIGYAAGTKLQICAYMTGRYAGMRNFGAIFGMMTSIVALATGVGPMLASLAHDLYGSYTPLLIAGIPGSLLSSILIFKLGPYPDWTSDPDARPDSGTLEAEMLVA